MISVDTLHTIRMNIILEFNNQVPNTCVIVSSNYRFIRLAKRMIDRVSNKNQQDILWTKINNLNISIRLFQDESNGLFTKYRYALDYIIRALRKELNEDINSPTEEHDVCAICLEPMNNNIINTVCNHKFHECCIMQWSRMKDKTSCPTCRHALSI